MKSPIQCVVLLILSGYLSGCSGVREDTGAATATEPVASRTAVSASEPLLHQILENHQSIVTAANRQIVLAYSTTAEPDVVIIRTFEYQAGVWQAKYPQMTGSGGKNGFAPFDQKAEGDGRAPTGIFDLVAAFGYHETAETRMPYRQATDQDFWIDDSASENYNQWLRLESGIRPGVSHERLRRDDHLYEYLIVIDYNSDPVVKNKGSAIFLHVERAPGIPTVGCIATSRDNMKALFKWLDPAKSPIIIMGTKRELTGLGQL